MTWFASQHYNFYLLLIHAIFTGVWRIVQESIPYGVATVHNYLQEYGNYLLALVGVTLTQFRLVTVTFTWPCTKFTQLYFASK